MSLEWNAEKLIEQMQAAEVKALTKTADKIADTSKGIVRVDTEALKNSIKRQGEPTTDGKITSVEVGSDEPNIPYAAIQELGPSTPRPYSWTPYMRPALDREIDSLAENLKKELGL